MIQPVSFTYFINVIFTQDSGETFKFSSMRTVENRVLSDDDVYDFLGACISTTFIESVDSYDIIDFKLVSENLPTNVVSIYHIFARGINQLGKTLVEVDTIYRLPSDERLDYVDVGVNVLQTAKIYNRDVYDVCITSLTHVRDEAR